jgi:phage shock protein PspC (stress-responsive transcriptional regulator)
MTEPSSPPAGEGPLLAEFAWRQGLVRPVQGRTFAGVCGAFARATDTAPALWRVILATLSIFGGIGLLVYLLAWLLLPADGDTASPLESLAGRGRSRTTTIRTVTGVVMAVIALAGTFAALRSFEPPYRGAALIALVLLGGGLLLLRGDRRGGGARPAPGEDRPE